jgi:hypothetical protein
MHEIDAYWKWWYETETGEKWDDPQWDHPYEDLFTECLHEEERREV